MSAPAPRSLPHSRPRPRRRQGGSAYLIVLFLLVLVTVFGLSLSVITQTESQIGASERIATRNFFAVESGIALGVARKQVTNTETGRVFDSLDAHTAPDSGLNLANRIELSPFVMLSEGPCNLCSINDRQGVEFKQTEHVQNITAARTANGTAIALKQVSRIIGFQPTTTSISAMKELEESSPAIRKSIRY